MIAKSEYFRKKDDKESPEVDPTQEEIQERAAAIRRQWSQRTRERRRVGHEEKHWLPPIVDLDQIVEPSDN